MTGLSAVDLWLHKAHNMTSCYDSVIPDLSPLTSVYPHDPLYVCIIRHISSCCDDSFVTLA